MRYFVIIEIYRVIILCKDSFNFLNTVKRADKNMKLI